MSENTAQDASNLNFEVGDEEYNRRRKMKSLRDLEDNIHKTAREAEGRVLLDPHTTQDVKNRALYVEVEEYIQEVLPYLHRHEKGDYYLEKVPLGVEIAPYPRIEHEPYEIASVTLHPHMENPAELPRIAFTGLREFRKLPRELELHWTYRWECPWDGWQDEETVTTMTVPESVSKNAAIATADFLEEAGLGASSSEIDEQGEPF